MSYFSDPDAQYRETFYKIENQIKMAPQQTTKLMPRAVTDGDIILATMDLSMPPGRVYDALITDEVEVWWGSPEIYRMTNWKADLRVGGKWTVGVKLNDGNTLPASGTFIELDKPRKIVHTRRYDWDHPLLGRRETVVTYRLDPIDTGTRVTVRHEGFGGLRAVADEHADGWERVLAWLDTYAGHS
jgi:uncharacterized protein YndB with AHSA1/START domain